MTITYNWKISNLERDASDGYVFVAHWNVEAVSSDIGPDGRQYTAQAYGTVGFERPENLIPFDSLTEDLVVSWVKEKLSEVTEPEPIFDSELNDYLPVPPTESELESLEKGLAEVIASQKNPSSSAGVPWVTD